MNELTDFCSLDTFNQRIVVDKDFVLRDEIEYWQYGIDTCVDTLITISSYVWLFENRILEKNVLGTNIRLFYSVELSDDADYGRKATLLEKNTIAIGLFETLENATKFAMTRYPEVI